jgi:nucleotide-binding universal stress UspA family protein
MIVKRNKKNLFFRKILVFVDGSKKSDKVLEIALQIADAIGSEVEILFVHKPAIALNFRYPMSGIGAPLIPNYSQMVHDFNKNTRIDGKHVLIRNYNKAKRIYPNLEVKTKLLDGKPALEILKESEEGSYNLIVIGAKGQRRLKPFFLNIVDTVVNNSNMPVLIVN